MQTWNERIVEVRSFFLNDDVFLGYRKLMNCVMDTQNMSFYKKIIALTDWKEQNPDDLETLTQRSIAILDEIATIDIPIANREDAIVKANHITKSYNSGKFHLGPVNLEIKKGNVYGLVGENGNGKTTLLRLLAKEITLSSGSLNYHLGNVKSDYSLKTKLIYIPQRTQKWYGSLKDNLKFVLTNYGFFPEENETRVLMMIARLGLWKFKDLKWSELSSGYKMRFELARTLLRKPELLLLDEPLANLDVLAQQTILEDLVSIADSINNPIALILSSQQLYEVEKVSDKVIYLKDGKYTDNNASNEVSENTPLIVELESSAERAALQHVFDLIGLEKLVFNGGVYVAYFKSTTHFTDVLLALGNHNITVTYLRNISASTRRFFVS